MRVEQALKPSKSNPRLCLYLEAPETNATSVGRNSAKTMKKRTERNSAVKTVKSSMKTRKNLTKKRKSASSAD